MKDFFRYSDIAEELYKKNSKGIVHKRKKIKGMHVDDMMIKEVDNVYNKKVGRYVLVDPMINVRSNDTELVEVLSRYLKLLARAKTKWKKRPHILVVGLGNRSYAPDSLGPLTVDRIEVNNHLKEDEIIKNGSNSFISTFTPGVMAQTGLESSDMVRAIVKNEGIDLVIAIDSLATRTIRRLNRVFQLTDTGINPGSGIGNNRKEVSADYLDVPVIALGVATVIDSVAIVMETINKMELSEDVADEVANSMMKVVDERLVVATKDIDSEIVSIANIVSQAINNAFK